jgi:phage replication-related protein YjqB (UPF0714/DUF867 family)
MPDRYSNFAELAEQEWESTNYQIRFMARTGSSDVVSIQVQRVDSKILIMAPHGGKIEPFTQELAEQIAGDRFSCYTFAALKPRDNQDLHLTSTRFDEPHALKALQWADFVLTVHGEKTTSKEFVIVGGLATDAIAQIETALKAIDIPLDSSNHKLAGKDPCNLCNRGRLKQGIQLELSRGLRNSLHDDDLKRQAFTQAIVGVLEQIEKAID